MSEKASAFTSYLMNEEAQHEEIVEIANNDGEVKPKVHFSLLSAIGVQYSVLSPPIAIG